MSGARHRRKGSRIEREIVDRHRELGVQAERYPLSGSSRFRGKGHDVDLYIFGKDAAPAVAEVKGRKNGAGFNTLERWLDDYDALFLRRNNTDPMVLLPWRTWAFPARAGAAMKMDGRKSEKDKELADGERLLRAWKRWHREQLEEALEGVHADVMRRLMAQLEGLRSARALVEFVAAQDWDAIDTDTRAICLHEIDRAITALREHMGQMPFDDALWGEPLTAFQVIHGIITRVSAQAEEPAAGRASSGK